MRNTFADTMLGIGQEDPNLAVLVGDISHYALQPFAEACPGRFYNVGILEPTIISMAAGLASVDLYPVVHTIAPFIVERGFEQLKLDFCYQNLGGSLISVGSAFDYAQLGCTHHCYNDIAMIKSLPNTEVIYPAMPNEFRQLFKQTYKNNKLTYFRLPGTQHEQIIPDEELVLGKGIKLKSGSDITLIGTGPQLKTMMDSISLFNDKGIDAEVLYFPTIKPIDVELVRDSLQKTKCVLVAEEHSQYGGLGDEILRIGSELDSVRYHFVNIPNEFLRGYGSYQIQCQKLGLTPPNIYHQGDLLIKSKKG
jgi:transketolase